MEGGEAGARWYCGSMVSRNGGDILVRVPMAGPCRLTPTPQFPATSPPAPQPLTSSSAMQGRDSEVLRRTEWPLARDVDDRRLLRAPLQLLGMLKAQRLW